MKTEALSEIQAIYPANSLQQDFISQPFDDTYHVQSLFDYFYELEIRYYQQAWVLAIETYPSLRTCFNWDESPIQIITKHGQLHFTERDLSLEADKDAALLALQQLDRKLHFDLTKPTLLRLYLLKQGTAHYTLLKTEHHSIADAWSAVVLLNQVHRYYEQLVSGVSPNIIQDMAYLQAQAYIVKHQTEAQRHWQQMMQGFNQANDVNVLFTKRVDLERLKTVQLASEKNIELAPLHYQQLKSLVHNEGLTMHVLVQFAWHKILQTYTGDTQTLVGTTISGRELPVALIEESVGLYINTLPLIVRWDKDATVKEQLQIIQQQVMGLNKYSFVYLAALQTQGRRLFHSLLLFENKSIAIKKPTAGQLTATNCRGVQKLDYPLVLTLHVQNDTLRINFKYDGVYLSDHRADQVLQQLLLVLQQIPCQLNDSHHTINLLTRSDYQQVIHAWNATNVTYPHDKTLHAMFEAQVLRTPDKVALVYGGQRLTYSKLDRQANQLAHYLCQLGLGEDGLVLLCLERSVELLIGILGVLKAGCAYVPIDPDYPLERIRYVLDDTESSFILTQRRFVARLTSLLSADVLCVVLDEQPYRKAPHTPLLLPRAPSDLAYVLYTSGTTGRAKGVLMSHTSVVNRLDWMQRSYPIDEHDVILQKTPYGFDVSVWELLWAHWTGAKIVMARPGGHKDPIYLHELIQGEGVTVLHFVPSMLAVFTQTLKILGKCVPDTVRYMFCSGEELSAGQVDAFYQVSGDRVAVHNLYGPTEAAIDVTAFACHRGAAMVYLGRPIQNTRAYVLNVHLKPVPVGVVGELYLGGVGLARGYLHQPVLTAAAFINNPLVSDDERIRGDTRLYKTGDLVRWTADGYLDYVGRCDFQVKLHGLRIELAEIEQVMLRYPGIMQAVAVVAEQEMLVGIHQFIAAYYVGPVSSELLRAHIALYLPEYMVPSELMELESFPVTSNGKLDRAALPATRRVTGYF